MSHPNIIPFYGVYSSAEKLPRLCLVSPWMEGGNLAEHLEKFPGTPPIPLVGAIPLSLVSVLMDIRPPISSLDCGTCMIGRLCTLT
jgi:serine/threonine protein kinase